MIPGAFTIGSLQDEMTGVSLAGTQLRVNQYNMHDVEWNDVKVKKKTQSSSNILYLTNRKELSRTGSLRFTSQNTRANAYTKDCSSI